MYQGPLCHLEVREIYFVIKADHKIKEIFRMLRVSQRAADLTNNFSTPLSMTIFSGSETANSFLLTQ